MTSIHRSARAGAVVAVAVAVFSALLATPTSGADERSGPSYTPGSRGVGDPYFPLEGNGGYDVKHYDLRLDYDPATHHLAGTAVLRAVARKNLSRFDLDLSGFQVSAVTVGGAPATFTRDGQELVVTPAAGLPTGQTFRVQVTYAGVPSTISRSRIMDGLPYGWIYTGDGAFVACEPDAARTWFPSNDHPRDKASFRFEVTVPRSTKVVGNGTYEGHHVSGDTDTFVWTERRPMATYLATIGIGRWDFHRSTTHAGIPQLTAVDPALADRARRTHTGRLVGRITDYWAKRFGRYPFDSTGAVIDDVPDVGFSLETQSRPLYGFVPDPDTAAHELAHQWFGDSVSVRSWRDIWLNEGFATFGMWLWDEHTAGYSTYRQARDEYRAFARRDSFWRRAIADPRRSGMFSEAVYVRGGMTLAALRHKIGDRAFFTLLRTWVHRHRYGTATTAQFTRLAQRVSGVRLHHFFRVWLWRKARPGHL
jgi:aminopeptidase N